MSYGMQPVPLVGRNSPMGIGLPKLKPTVGGGAPGLPERDGATLDLDFTKGVLDQRITFTRASSGTRVGPNGLIESIPTNVPRFDHDTITCKPLGLLIEEQRTNLQVYSEDFSNNTGWPTASRAAVYVFGSGSTVDNVVAPDGASTADTFISNATASITPYFSSMTHSLSAGSATFSIYAKASGYSKLGIRESSASGAWATYNMSGGGTVIGSSGTSATSITALSNGWYRLTFSQTTSATNYSYRMFILDDAYSSGAPNSYTYTSDGTSGMTFWGGQLEAGAFPTSYIPTTSAAVVRYADVATMTGTRFYEWWNPRQGTLYAVKNTASNTANQAIVSIANTQALQNRVMFNCTVDTMYFTIKALNVDYSPQQSATLANSVPRVFSAAYSSNKRNAAFNGNIAAYQAASVLPGFVGVFLADRLVIGAYGDGSAATNGCISRFKYWPYAKTAQQLKKLTT